MFGVPQLILERWPRSAPQRRIAAALLAAGALALPGAAFADSHAGLPASSGFTPAPLAAGEACSVAPAGAEAYERFVAAVRSASATAPLAAPSAGPLGVTCALPYLRGRAGSDCTGSHIVQFATTGASPSAKITAELLGLTVDGTIIQALPVNAGDTVHMASRALMSDFKMSSKKNSHDVFAPVPMLRVTVEDQGQKVQAFCSNIPYLDVVEPSGGVVSESDGNVTNFVAAIPLVSESSLDLKVNGVHVFAGLGIATPGTCTSDLPCGGTLDVNGTQVTVENLIVDVALDKHIPSSNTLKATFKDLPCGEHVFVLNGQRLPNMPRNPTADVCVLDDTTDRATSSVFAVELTSPINGQIGVSSPTTVTGQVCSGRPVASLKLNGLAQPVTGLSCTPGDGENSGTVCVLPINASLGRTDIVKDITSGDEAPGTLDEGSNRLVAAAIDDLGNRAYDRVIFATGSTANPGVDLSALMVQSSMRTALDAEVQKMVLDSLHDPLLVTETAVENAFVVGLSAAGVQTLFDQLCTLPAPDTGKTAAQSFRESVEAQLLNKVLKTGSLDIPCACDPSYEIRVTQVQVGNTVTCPLDFSTPGKFRVDVNLPNITVTVRATGYCEDYDGPICWSTATVDMTSTGTVSGIKLAFDVTEDNLMNTATSPPSFTFSGTSQTSTSGGVSVGCLGAVCDFVVGVLTFGLVDFSPTLNISNFTNFSTEIAAAEPDPVKLNEIKVDEEQVVSFDQKLRGEVSSVTITPHGLVAGLTGYFATTAVDPEVEATPGATLTPAPLPTLPVPNAKDVFIGLSDDTLNMMLASMTTAGKLKTTCSDTNKTVNDLLPANCDALTGDTPLAAALARGACYGARVTLNCESLVMPDDANGVLTASAQGVCHAYRGDNCNALPLQGGLLAQAAEKFLCNNTPNPNINSTQPVLFCAKADIPPRMLLQDNASTSAVEATLRVNDLGVAMIVDRNGTGTIEAPLAELPGCFANGVPTVGDCNMFSSCMDLNFNFNMQFQTCSDGKPGFQNQFTSVQILNREAGLVCSGNSAATSDATVVGAAAEDSTVTIDLTSRAQQFAPPVCGAGLTMGGFVSCDAPSLLAIETGGSPALKDYIAITCDVKK
jgi:hypothetical protein